MWLKVAVEEKIGNSDCGTTNWIYNKINDEFILSKFFTEKFLVAFNAETHEYVIYGYNNDLKKYEIVFEEICKLLSPIKTLKLDDKSKVIKEVNEINFVENPKDIITDNLVLYRINSIDDYSGNIYFFDGPAFLVNDEGKTFERVSL